MTRVSFPTVIFLLLATLWPGSFAWAVDSRFSSYIEILPRGKIDWHKGYFYGVGTGYPHENNGSKARALKVAQAGALSAILQVASGLRVDDQRQLADLEREKLIIQIKGLVHYEPYHREFIKKGDHPHFRVTYRAPMTGVEGLTRRLLDQLRTRASSWQKYPKPGRPDYEDESLPWLVLDARRLEHRTRIQPALFPKIVTEKGETIYALENVDERALVKRGMARYVVSGKSHEELASWSCPSRPIARFLDLFSPGIAYAQERQKRKKRGKYIIKDVQEVQGLMKTNVVISESDAKSIRAEDASNQILKKCRVIVIASSSVGGIEGRSMKYLALGR